MKTFTLSFLFFFLLGNIFSQNTPVAVTDSVVTMMYYSTDIDVLANDYDPQGHPLELFQLKDCVGWCEIIDNKVQFKSLTLNGDAASFQYRVRRTDDTTVFSNWATVFIQLTTNPDLPVAINDTVSGSAAFPITIYPLKNDEKNGSNSIYISSLYGYPNNIFSSAEIDSNKVVVYPYFIDSGIYNCNYLIKDPDDAGIWIKGTIVLTINKIQARDSLTVNNINAGVELNGNLFSDLQYYPTKSNGNKDSKDTYFIRPHYEVPAGSGKQTIFTNKIWLGGLDENDSLHLAAERYGQVGQDYRYGPIANNYDSLFTLKYARVWKVSKQEIAYHRNNWWKPDYVAIDAIANWPGNGDVSNGEDEQLAPYFDRTKNGHYDPYDGDYPLIRGDQTVLLIFNDDKPHSETQGKRLKVEFITMVYGFDAPENDVLSNTVFVHYTMINRSENSYHDTYVGLFTDTDIGYAWDDYIGCNVQKSSYYGYNGKIPDGNGEPGSYGNNPPAQSVTFLAGPLMDADGADNPSGECDYSVNGQNFGDGIVDNERLGMTSFIYVNNGGNPGTSDPFIAPEYYNVVRGYWLDGSPLVYGGNGYTGSDSVGTACRFMFPGNSDTCHWGTHGQPLPDGYDNDSLTWTEFRGYNYGQNPPGDRRGVGASGPFTFESGGIQELDMAYVTSFGNDTLSSVEQLSIDLDSLFAKKTVIPDSTLGLVKHKITRNILEIFPNPAVESITVRFGSTIHSGTEFIIYNSDGKIAKRGILTTGNEAVIPINRLTAGFYIIKIAAGKSIYFGRFIKL